MAFHIWPLKYESSLKGRFKKKIIALQIGKVLLSVTCFGLLVFVPVSMLSYFCEEGMVEAA